MIPKIIHYCWFGRNPLPTSAQKCIDSWRKFLPEYEIKEWNEDNFDVNMIPYTQQAYEAKKYAFAADYIRLYALYNFGGIYLDADVLVYKSFDELLSLPYFIGCDQIRAFEAAVIGAEKECSWIKDIFDTYQGKHFIKEDGSLDIMELPVRFHHILTELNYKFIKISGIREFDKYYTEGNKIIVFSGDFFNSRNAVEVRQTKKSFCAHNYAGSWNKKGNTPITIKDRLPKWLLGMIYRVGQTTWARNKYAWFQIPFENK